MKTAEFANSIDLAEVAHNVLEVPVMKIPEFANGIDLAEVAHNEQDFKYQR